MARNGLHAWVWFSRIENPALLVPGIWMCMACGDCSDQPDWPGYLGCEGPSLIAGDIR